MLAICRKIRTNDGFTLIELLVVISVLGILAGIAVPRISGVQDRAKRAVLQANANTIYNAMEMYNAYVGHYPDISDVDSIEALNTKLNSGGLKISISADKDQFRIDNNDGAVQYDDGNNTYSITLEDTDETFSIEITQNGVGDVTEQS